MIKFWKTGLTILVLFVLFDILYISRSWAYFDSEDLVAVVYFIIATIALPLILALSLNLTERRTKKKYTFWWVVLFNIAVTVVLYVIAVLVSIIFAYIFSEQAGSESGLLVFIIGGFGLIIAPIVVIIFSLIPSLIYKARLKNKEDSL